VLNLWLAPVGIPLVGLNDRDRWRCQASLAISPLRGMTNARRLSRARRVLSCRVRTRTGLHFSSPGSITVRRRSGRRWLGSFIAIEYLTWACGGVRRRDRGRGPMPGRREGMLIIGGGTKADASTFDQHYHVQPDAGGDERMRFSLRCSTRKYIPCSD
jgi:hypothetical protein